MLANDRLNKKNKGQDLPLSGRLASRGHAPNIGKLIGAVSVENTRCADQSVDLRGRSVRLSRKRTGDSQWAGAVTNLLQSFIPVGSSQDQCGSIRHAAEDLPGAWILVSASLVPTTCLPRTELFLLRTHIEAHGQHLPDFCAAGHSQIAGCLAEDVGHIFVRHVDTLRSSGCTFALSEKKKKNNKKK